MASIFAPRKFGIEVNPIQLEKFGNFGKRGVPAPPIPSPSGQSNTEMPLTTKVVEGILARKALEERDAALSAKAEKVARQELDSSDYIEGYRPAPEVTSQYIDPSRAEGPELQRFEDTVVADERAELYNNELAERTERYKLWYMNEDAFNENLAKDLRDADPNKARGRYNVLADAVTQAATIGAPNEVIRGLLQRRNEAFNQSLSDEKDGPLVTVDTGDKGVKPLTPAQKTLQEERAKDVAEVFESSRNIDRGVSDVARADSIYYSTLEVAGDGSYVDDPESIKRAKVAAPLLFADEKTRARDDLLKGIQVDFIHFGQRPPGVMTDADFVELRKRISGPENNMIRRQFERASFNMKKRQLDLQKQVLTRAANEGWDDDDDRITKETEDLWRLHKVGTEADFIPYSGDIGKWFEIVGRLDNHLEQENRLPNPETWNKMGDNNASINNQVQNAVQNMFDRAEEGDEGFIHTLDMFYAIMDNDTKRLQYPVRVGKGEGKIEHRLYSVKNWLNPKDGNNVSGARGVDMSLARTLLERREEYESLRGNQ